jgi:predicted RNA binding protein YcfA (HicA-like mRNA interferase family)
MAVDDLDILRQELPEVFTDQAVPVHWEEDWLAIPIDDPEAFQSEAENPPDFELAPGGTGLAQDTVAPFDGTFSPESQVPDFGDIVFPGVPAAKGHWLEVPPPDALAFYLPFHYFHPTWWGIYIVLERLHEFADALAKYSGRVLTFNEALNIGKMFLYGHEAFHHIAESFATRLEVTHRFPIYTGGFERLFRRVYGTDDCIEEALASSHGYRKVKAKAFRRPNDPRKRGAALHALERYIKLCPPGYRRALEFVGDSHFSQERSAFAEQNHNETLPPLPRKGPPIWLSFPHAFSGISRITSRVNYLVHRNSPLAQRTRLGLRYLRYRDLADRLKKLAGCQPVRQGHGSHEIWETPKGHRFPVPRHPGDFGRGLLAKIIKEAGLNLSVSEFVEARV